jgi:hypothetical protein
MVALAYNICAWEFMASLEEAHTNVGGGGDWVTLLSVSAWVAMDPFGM